MCKKKAARSMSGVAVFVDEAHFLPRRSIENGPLAMIAQGAKVVMASTPATGDSGIQNVLDAKLDGKPICTVVDFEFNCPMCKKRQLKDPGYVCTHRLYLRPHVQDSRNIMIARAAYGPDSDAYKREMLGSAVFGSHDFIDHEDIVFLRDCEPYVSNVAPRYMYISCDPSGATKKYMEDATSDYAIVAAFIQDGRLVIANAFVAFHDELRRQPLFKNTTFLYIFENNLGYEQSHLRSIVQKVDRIRINSAVLFENEAVVGFHTSAQSKLRADDRLQDYITAKALRFTENIVSVNPDSARTGPRAKEMLIKQIENMKEYVKQNPNGTARRIVSGIYSENNTRLSQKDDVQRALSNLVLASTLFMTKRLPVNYTAIANMRSRRKDVEVVDYIHKTADDGSRFKRLREDHLTNIPHKHNANRLQ